MAMSPVFTNDELRFVVPIYTFLQEQDTVYTPHEVSGSLASLLIAEIVDLLCQHEDSVHSTGGQHLAMIKSGQ